MLVPPPGWPIVGDRLQLRAFGNQEWDSQAWVSGSSWCRSSWIIPPWPISARRGQGTTCKPLIWVVWLAICRAAWAVSPELIVVVIKSSSCKFSALLPSVYGRWAEVLVWEISSGKTEASWPGFLCSGSETWNGLSPLHTKLIWYLFRTTCKRHLWI